MIMATWAYCVCILPCLSDIKGPAGKSDGNSSQCQLKTIGFPCWTLYLYFIFEYVCTGLITLSIIIFLLVYIIGTI